MKWNRFLCDANTCCWGYTSGRFKITENYKPGWDRLHPIRTYSLYMDNELIGTYESEDDAKRIAEGIAA